MKTKSFSINFLTLLDSFVMEAPARGGDFSVWNILLDSFVEEEYDLDGFLDKLKIEVDTRPFSKEMKSRILEKSELIANLVRSINFK